MRIQALVLLIGSVGILAGAADVAGRQKLIPKGGPSTVSTMENLRALAPGSSSAVLLLGFHSPGDGGGGTFFWDASSVALENAGTLIVPDAGPSSGRWRRLTSETLSARWFGAIGDGSTHPLSGFFASLPEAQTLYPHAQTLSEELDWAAIQAALEQFSPTGPSGIPRQGGGELRVPAGDYWISQPLDIRVDSTAVVGEVEGATRLTYSNTTPLSGPFAFFRAGIDTTTEVLFRTHLWNFALDMGQAGPSDARGIDVTGMSNSDFRNLDMQFRTPGCSGIYGHARNGSSPYYNLFTNISVAGPAPFATSNCRGYHFTADPSLSSTHPDARKAPNANTVRGGRLASLQIGYDDSGTGNSVFGVTIESVNTAFDIGEDTVTGPHQGFSSTTNNTTLIGNYLEGGAGVNSSNIHVRDSATLVKFIDGYSTGFDNEYIDEGHITTILPGTDIPSFPHGKLGGYIDSEFDIQTKGSFVFDDGTRLQTSSGVPLHSPPNGTLYLRTDGGVGSTLYVRESGSWVSK